MMSNEGTKRSAMIYYQVVSVALMLVMVGFGISGLWGLVGLAWPSLTIESSTFRQYRTRAQYLQDNYIKRHGRYYRSMAADTSGVSVDDATEVWRDARAEALATERRNSGRQLAMSLIAFAVCLPLYRQHHRVVQRAHESDKKGEG
jgi:hypothetical protein